MTRSKFIASAVAGLMAVSVLAGCAASTKPEAKKDDTAAAPAQTVELRALWWGAQDRHDATLKAIDAYMKKHPNIKITSEFSGWDTYWDKASVKVASGDAPDLIQMDFGYIMDYAGRNALLDLTPYVGKGLDLTAMDKNLIDSGKVDGKLYGVALGANVMAMMVNKTILDKAGLAVPPDNWTWKDVESLDKQLRDKLGKDYYFMPDNTHVMAYFEYWLRQHGKPGMFSGAKFNFTEADLVEYWKYFDGLRKQGLIPTGDVTTAYGGFGGPVESSLWTKQKSALWFGWTAEYPKYSSLIKDEVVMLPFPGGGTAPGSYPKPSMYWSVYAKSKHPKEAADFISWFINDPEAAKILASTRGVPGTTTAIDVLKQAGLSKTDGAVFDSTQKFLKTAGPTPQPNPKGGTDLQSLFTRLVEAQAFGRTTPEEAAKQFITDGTKILQKANGN